MHSTAKPRPARSKEVLSLVSLWLATHPAEAHSQTIDSLQTFANRFLGVDEMPLTGYSPDNAGLLLIADLSQILVKELSGTP